MTYKPNSLPSLDIWSTSCRVGTLYFCEIVQLLVVIVMSGFSFGVGGCGGAVVGMCLYTAVQSVPAGLPGALDVLCAQLWESDPSSPVPALFLRRCLVMGFFVSLVVVLPFAFITPSFIAYTILGHQPTTLSSENEDHIAIANYAANLLQSLWILLPFQGIEESLRRFLLARDEGREQTLSILTSWSVFVTVIHGGLSYTLIPINKGLGVTMTYMVTTVFNIIVYFSIILTTSDRSGNSMLLKGGGFIPHRNGGGDRGYQSISRLCIPGIIGIALVRIPFEISPLAASWLVPSRIIFQGITMCIFKLCYSLPLVVSQAITLTAGRALSCNDTDRAKGVVRSGLLFGLLIGPFMGLIFIASHTVVLKILGIRQESGAASSAACFAVIDTFHSCCVGILRGTSSVSHSADSSRRLVSYIQAIPFIIIYPIALFHFPQFGIGAHWGGLAVAQAVNTAILLVDIRRIPWAEMTGFDLMSEYTPLNPIRKSGRITPSG